MSDISRMTEAEHKAGIGVYVTDGVGEGSVDRASKLLAGIKGGFEKALASAIKRAASSGESFAAKAIREEYTVSSADFKKYTTSTRKYQTDASGTTVDLVFRGYHIPLLRFSHSLGKDGRVSVSVKKSSAGAELDHVFVAQMPNGGHLGLFERETDARLPIRQLYGPSTPQMMEANDDVSQAIGDHIRETFDKRMDHEVTRILNGWGK